MPTTISQPGWNPYDVPSLPVRRFTVEEYHELIRSGFFSEDERFELLEGWIVPKMSREPLHDATAEPSCVFMRERG